jgi:thioredoxin 2
MTSSWGPRRTALQERFGVRGIPTLVLMDEGKERDRVTGAMNAEALRRWVESRLPAHKGTVT